MYLGLAGEMICLPMIPRATVADWWSDYVSDPLLRTHYFVTGREQLIDPEKFHHGRLWKADKIIVPAGKYLDVISRHHDLLPS